MASPRLSPAKVILLAVEATTKADTAVLRTLIAKHPTTLNTILVLRILLTYLPETLESAEYVQFLIDLDSGNVSQKRADIDASLVETLTDDDAQRKVRKLHLLSLAWPNKPSDAPEDPLIDFIIHRAYRIDQQTGLISQLPELIAPFIGRSEYLRKWMISSVLPIVRLNYEYHPHHSSIRSITEFEDLDAFAAVESLLSRDEEEDSEGSTEDTVTRDLRGLAGPWLYGGNQWKRQKVRLFSMEAQAIAPLDDDRILEDDTYQDWDAVFKWIESQASISWHVSLKAFGSWDGPGDVDLGGYGDDRMRLNEQDVKLLTWRYSRAALAAIYLIPDASTSALESIQQVLAKVIHRLSLDPIPSLPAAAALLSPVAGEVAHIVHKRVDIDNVLIEPTKLPIYFLHALLVSAFLLGRAGFPCTVRMARDIALYQDEAYQLTVLDIIIGHLTNGPKGDDKFWIRTRNELLWLHDWGLGQTKEGASDQQGHGLLGTINRDTLEKTILKTLLANTRYTLAQSIYEQSPDPPLAKKDLQETIASAAMHAYDNASNPNKTRGGVKKCDDIMKAFPDTVKGSLVSERMTHLINATHILSKYRLVLKEGEPFKPIMLRTHGDPICIIGKIMAQNTRIYTDVDEFLRMGEEIVLAGLTVRDVEGYSKMVPEMVEAQLSLARRRVISMCIDAALSEDDFETAYSYVMNRLPSIAAEAYARPTKDTKTPNASAAIETDGGVLKARGIIAQPPPVILDDWSWRAALQAGKYRLNAYTVKPTHVGNASGNPEIRHLEQRMECLAQALRIAPPSTLQEILNAFRRCEEELDTKIREEAEQEEAWDEQGDEKVMPGRFGMDAPVNLSRAGAATSNAKSRTGDEAPMSLFDLTRASAAKAQQSLSALTSVRNEGSSRDNQGSIAVSDDGSHIQGVKPSTVRKRDQLRNAAVGTLASGIGWLINAPPVVNNTEDEK